MFKRLQLSNNFNQSTNSERAAELKNVEICHLHTEGEAPYANPELAESFHVNSFFIGANVRHTLKAGNGSYTPVFLSELPYLFRKNVLPLNVVLFMFRHQIVMDIVLLEFRLKQLWRQLKMQKR
jgi:acyl-CoA hydrolase